MHIFLSFLYLNPLPTVHYLLNKVLTPVHNHKRPPLIWLGYFFKLFIHHQSSYNLLHSLSILTFLILKNSKVEEPLYMWLHRISYFLLTISFIYLSSLKLNITEKFSSLVLRLGSLIYQCLFASDCIILCTAKLTIAFHFSHWSEAT